MISRPSFKSILLISLLIAYSSAAGSQSQTPVPSPSESISESPEYFHPDQDDFHCPMSIKDVFKHNLGDEENIYEDDLGPIEGNDKGLNRFKYRFIAKAENHPNSTVIDDIIDSDNNMNNTLYYDGLQFAIDNSFHSHAAISNISRDLAIHLLTYGSGYVQTTELDVEGVRYVAVMAFTFDSERIEYYLKELNLSLPDPFIPGVFVEYNHNRHETRIFGAAFGLQLFFDHRTGKFSRFIGPQVGVALFDTVVPYCSRDFDNKDGDVVCHTETVNGNHIFNSKKVPIIIKFAAAYLNGTIFVDFNGAFSVANLTMGLNTGVVTDIYSPTMNFRLGNGIDDTGILGALPVVDSVYMTFSSNLYNYLGDPTKKVGGLGRFRFVLFGCATNCPHGATHVLDNHPDFSMSPIFPPQKLPVDWTVKNYTDISSGLYGYLMATIPDALFGKNGETVENYSGQHYSIRAGLGVYIDSLQVGEGVHTSLFATTQFNHEIAETVYNYLPLLAQQYIATITDITLKDFGLYMNFRNAPVEVKVFGVATGVSFFEDPAAFNISGHVGRFLPSAALISFGTGDHIVARNGYRMEDSKDIVIDNSIINERDGKVHVSLVITGINDDGFSHLSQQTVPFGLTSAADYFRVGIYDPEEPTEVTLTGRFHTIDNGKGLVGNATVLCSVKPCARLTDDSFGEDGNDTSATWNTGSIVITSILSFVAFLLFLQAIVS